MPLAVYGLVLGGTAALSTRFGPLVAVGGASFLISDTLIAFREFMGVPEWVGQLVMPTYVLGQGLIVFGVVQLLRRTPE
ncbi:lysoplasmalogenase family protein [Leucobacter soli]|uniref:lysoplasmalogenase family protein n=1 Tax=Leucobacter soli TaxID=2812850 RepID=UPI00360CB04C